MEVFARGFSYVRSRTHPYEATANAVPGYPGAAPLWVLRDAERRRGNYRALLCRMLRDDRAHGATMAVLTSSHPGAKLYPLVGYRQIGLLLAYTPRRAASG